MNKELISQMFTNIYVTFLTCIVLISNAYAEDGIIGKWNTIDDKSGVARAVVRIYKNADETYAGKVEKIYPQLNQSEPFHETCFRCKGKLKDAKVVGMQILSGFVINPQKENEYINGKILDPVSGETYKSKIKLSKNNRRLNLRGYVGISQLGRSQTWIRIE
jgi:uncharacterized protein (DUF2147 family)